MEGNLFVEILREQFQCANIYQLSKKLGVSAATIGNWSKGSLTKTIVKNAFSAVRTTLISESIKPIVEFHNLDLLHGHKTDSFSKRINNKKIVERLQQAKGIYSFYDSQGHIIYCGKTNGNLLTEMNQAYGLARPGYRRKRVSKDANFQFLALTIRETAAFVSAYEVDADLISNLEAFVTRLVPNNIINLKTERFA